MRNRILILALSLVTVMSVQSAMAWGTVGHRVAAYIAEQHLTPEAKEKSRYYLKHTLAYYAMWMDSWRGVEGFQSINNGHSILIKDDGRSLKWEGSVPPGRALGHLVNAYNELGNGKYKNLPDSVVAQRLINMIHYVPDMHCPCHCNMPESMYTPQRTYKLFRNGKKADFHSFWDGSISFNRRKWTVKKYTEVLDRDVDPKLIKKWQQGLEKKNFKKGLEKWALDCSKNSHRMFVIMPEGFDLANLTAEQKREVNDIADLGVLMGAYRLAYVLNTIFKE